MYIHIHVDMTHGFCTQFELAVHNNQLCLLLFTKTM